MAGATVITIVGTMVQDPDLKVLDSGHSVANFSVASNERIYDQKSGDWKDGETIFMKCSLWRDAAENAAETLRQGHRVIITGRLRQRKWEKEGQKHTSTELEVDEIGPSLKWARAVITKQGKSDNGGGRSAPAASGGGFDEAPPFYHQERFCNAF